MSYELSFDVKFKIFECHHPYELQKFENSIKYRLWARSHRTVKSQIIIKKKSNNLAEPGLCEMSSFLKTFLLFTVYKSRIHYSSSTKIH